MAAADAALSAIPGYDLTLASVKARNWRSKPHPQMMLPRADSKLQQKYPKDVLDIVNDFHAYCSICDCHIYHRSDASDLFSFAPGHFANASHKTGMNRDGDILDILECKLCGQRVTHRVWAEEVSFDKVIDRHIISANHKYNSLCVDNDEMGFLRTVAMTGPIQEMVRMVTPLLGFCEICGEDFGYAADAHHRTHQHIVRLGMFLEKEFKFSMTDLNNDELLKQLLKNIQTFANKGKKPAEESPVKDPPKKNKKKKNKAKTEDAKIVVLQRPTPDPENCYNFDEEKNKLICVLCQYKISVKAQEPSKVKEEISEKWKNHLELKQHVLNVAYLKYEGSDAMKRIVELPVVKQFTNGKNQKFADVFKAFYISHKVCLATVTGVFRRESSDDTYLDAVNDALVQFIDVKKKKGDFWIYGGVNLRTDGIPKKLFLCDECNYVNANDERVKQHIDTCESLKDLSGVHSFPCSTCQCLVISRWGQNIHNADNKHLDREIREQLKSSLVDEPTPLTSEQSEKLIKKNKFLADNYLIITPDNWIQCTKCIENLLKCTETDFKKLKNYPQAVLYHIGSPRHCLAMYRMEHPSLDVLKKIARLPGVLDLIFRSKNHCLACNSFKLDHIDSDAHLAKTVNYFYSAMGIHLFFDLGLQFRSEQDIDERLEMFNEAFLKFADRLKNLGRKGKREPPVFRVALGINLEPTDPSIDGVFCDDCVCFSYINNAARHFERCLLQKGLDGLRSFTCEDCEAVVVTRFDLKQHKINEGLYAEEREKQKLKNRHRRCQEQLECVLPATILKLTSLPNDDIIEELIREAFKDCGKLEEIELKPEENSANVRFWMQSCAEFALALKTVTIKGVKVKVSKITYDSCSYPVALAEKTIAQLFASKNLQPFCEDLAKRAAQVFADPNQRRCEEILLRTLKLIVATLNKKDEVWDVLPFGSRFIGLALEENADLDVFTGTRSSFYGQSLQNASQQKNLVFRVADLLSRCPEFKMIETIARARVPILKFVHEPTGLRCDLSFLNGLSVVNSDLVRFFLKLDDRVAPMVLYVKDWVATNGFKGYLTSYAASILVIVYLGQLAVPVLPTLAMLRSRAPKQIFIQGWNATFDETFPWLSRNESNITKLLAGFFKFYAEFDYAEYVIYPVTAGKVPRSYVLNSEDHKKIPADFESCSKFFDPGLYIQRIDMCVMDPFNFSHNITSRLGLCPFTALIDLFNRSAKLLSHHL